MVLITQGPQYLYSSSSSSRSKFLRIFLSSFERSQSKSPCLLDTTEYCTIERRSRMAKKPRAPVHSAEHMLREQGVAPVWQPQINEQWKHGTYERSVRLPSVDLRQPLAKTEGAADGTPERSSKAKLSTSFTSSTSKQPPQAKVNLPSTKQEQLVTELTRSQFARSTQVRGGHVGPPSRKLEHAVSKSSKSQLSRRTRGRGDSRNVMMRQARLRYEQEKLAIQEQHQQKPAGSIDVIPKNLPTEVRRGSPVAGTTTIQRANFNVQHHSAHQSFRPTNVPRPFQSSPNPAGIHESRSAVGRTDNVYPRLHSSAHKPKGSFHYPQPLSSSVVRHQDGWSSWLELRVKVFGLPTTVTTLDLWQCFSKEGIIDAVEIFEDGKGTRDGKASVRYR